MFHQVSDWALKANVTHIPMLLTSTAKITKSEIVLRLLIISCRGRSNRNPIKRITQKRIRGISLSEGALNLGQRATA